MTDIEHRNVILEQLRGALFGGQVRFDFSSLFDREHWITIGELTELGNKIFSLTERDDICVVTQWIDQFFMRRCDRLRNTHVAPWISPDSLANKHCIQFAEAIYPSYCALLKSESKPTLLKMFVPFFQENVRPVSYIAAVKCFPDREQQSLRVALQRVLQLAEPVSEDRVLSNRCWDYFIPLIKNTDDVKAFIMYTEIPVLEWAASKIKENGAESFTGDALLDKRALLAEAVLYRLHRLSIFSEYTAKFFGVGMGYSKQTKLKAIDSLIDFLLHQTLNPDQLRDYLNENVPDEQVRKALFNGNLKTITNYCLAWRGRVEEAPSHSSNACVR